MLIYGATAHFMKKSTSRSRFCSVEGAGLLCNGVGQSAGEQGVGFSPAPLGVVGACSTKEGCRVVGRSRRGKEEKDSFCTFKERG